MTKLPLWTIPWESFSNCILPRARSNCILPRARSNCILPRALSSSLGTTYLVLLPGRYTSTCRLLLLPPAACCCCYFENACPQQCFVRGNQKVSPRHVQTMCHTPPCDENWRFYNFQVLIKHGCLPASLAVVYSDQWSSKWWSILRAFSILLLLLSCLISCTHSRTQTAAAQPTYSITTS